MQCAWGPHSWAYVCVYMFLICVLYFRASFGTTKYCSFYLRGLQCTKPVRVPLPLSLFCHNLLLSLSLFLSQDCMYLHELGDIEASFTKEDMQQGYTCCITLYLLNTDMCCSLSLPLPPPPLSLSL